MSFRDMRQKLVCCGVHLLVLSHHEPDMALLLKGNHALEHVLLTCKQRPQCWCHLQRQGCSTSLLLRNTSIDVACCWVFPVVMQRCFIQFMKVIKPCMHKSNVLLHTRAPIGLYNSMQRCCYGTLHTCASGIPCSSLAVLAPPSSRA